jgi:TRAP-type mannitol/chloroaromatic compound transport system substrate-binding protein
MKKDKTQKIDKNQKEKKTTRRKFLKTAAVAGVAGAATLGFPMVSRAQTTVLKMQGAWGAKDIFNDYANDYVKRVNEMAGGRLKIQYLISGAVVKAFRVQDAVHKGVLDAGHQVCVYVRYGTRLWPERPPGAGLDLLWRRPGAV